jgi:hypothetical protein
VPGLHDMASAAAGGAGAPWRAQRPDAGCAATCPAAWSTCGARWHRLCPGVLHPWRGPYIPLEAVRTGRAPCPLPPSLLALLHARAPPAVGSGHPASTSRPVKPCMQPHGLPCNGAASMPGPACVPCLPSALFGHYCRAQSNKRQVCNAANGVQPRRSSLLSAHKRTDWQLLCSPLVDGPVPNVAATLLPAAAVHLLACHATP